MLRILQTSIEYGTGWIQMNDDKKAKLVLNDAWCFEHECEKEECEDKHQGMYKHTYTLLPGVLPSSYSKSIEEIGEDLKSKYRRIK